MASQSRLVRRGINISRECGKNLSLHRTLPIFPSPTDALGSKTDATTKPRAGFSSAAKPSTGTTTSATATLVGKRPPTAKSSSAEAAAQRKRDSDENVAINT